jgi:hypothetical protein
MSSGNPGTFNPYAYAAANPATNSDPSGQRTCSGPQDCAGDPTHGNTEWGNGSTRDSSANSPNCNGSCFHHRHPRSHPDDGNCAGTKGQACPLTPEEEQLKRQAQEMLAKYGNNPRVCTEPIELKCKTAPPDTGDFTIAWCHMVGAMICKQAYELQDMSEIDSGPNPPNGDFFDPAWNARHHGTWFAYEAAAGIPEHDLMLLAVAHELDSEGSAPNYGSVDSRADMRNNIIGIKIGKNAANHAHAPGDEYHARDGSRYDLKTEIANEVDLAATEGACGDLCFDLNERPR